MKKAFLIAIQIYTGLIALSQSADHPKVERSTGKDVYIKSVTSTSNYTEVTFVFFNTGKDSYIYLLPPGHLTAYYIKANGTKYKLLSTKGISQSEDSTVAYTHECLEFSAKFEKIPGTTAEIDLIEGENGAWNFFGVQLDTPASINQRFRRDYKYMTTMKDGSWQNSISSETIFVFNANEDADINIYFEASGKKVTLSIIGSISKDFVNGYDYQSVSAIDEEGAELTLKIFDDPINGVFMIFGEGNLIQYHN